MKIPILMTYKQALLLAVGAFVLAWIVKFAAGIAFNLLLILSVIAIVYGVYLAASHVIGALYDDHTSGLDD